MTEGQKRAKSISEWATSERLQRLAEKLTVQSGIPHEVVKTARGLVVQASV